MALLNPTFLLGVVVVTYLSSFVFFAILRILTGISIQRIGYFALKRLTYKPSVGVAIDIRSLGLNIHRPTFAQPTWLSIVLRELVVTVDLNATEKEKLRETGQKSSPRKDTENSPKKQVRTPDNNDDRHKTSSSKLLTRIKNGIKSLHRKIYWIRMVDLVATNLTVNIVDVGNVQVGSFSMAVDTRRKMVDLGRMFSRVRTLRDLKLSAEWIFSIRSILFTVEGGESSEILDHMALNIHGLLCGELDELKDASISLKLGRVHIPYEEIKECVDRYQLCCKRHENFTSSGAQSTTPVHQSSREKPTSLPENAMKKPPSPKELIGTVIRGVNEVQFAVSFISFTKKTNPSQTQLTPINFHASMKEVGIDLHRLDQKSPAHRMYFSANDTAHQALVAALSIAIGIDDGAGNFERLTYIPMATTTVRTTLPSKTIDPAISISADERNANILFANVVITSLSVDLNPKNLALLSSMHKFQPKTIKKIAEPQKHSFISQFLPKANVKFSMHEPVFRISLPPVEENAREDDFDLIISSISSISLDIESSHSAIKDLHYCLGSTFRLQSHALYYQTSMGAHHQLVETESLELKAQILAKNELSVTATGNLQTFSIHMNRPEIIDGVRHIVRQLNLDSYSGNNSPMDNSQYPNCIRALPHWLLYFSIQGSDFSVEVAGIDEEITEDTRGLALRLKSWTAEYCSQNQSAKINRGTPKHTASWNLSTDPGPESKSLVDSRQNNQLPRGYPQTNGRRLCVHVKGLEAFVIEPTNEWQVDPIVAMPKIECTLSTTSDRQGPIFHIILNVYSLFAQYSLYQHYACGVAIMILRRAFVRTQTDKVEAENVRNVTEYDDESKTFSEELPSDNPITLDEAILLPKELISIHFKASVLQVKAIMPSDPDMMLQIYGIEVESHRWSPPFVIAKLVRVYAQAPKIPQTWARVISVKSLRIDHREARRKTKTGDVEDENLIDVKTEAVRLAIPHQLIVHRVMDNFVNTLKSVKQLHNQFSSGNHRKIEEKHLETPTIVPNILIRSKVFLFELEDGAFEWKLGVIYRTGLVEQEKRLARETAFNMKAKKIGEEVLKNKNKQRNRPSNPRGRSKFPDSDRPRSRSEDGLSSQFHRSHSPPNRKLCYNPDKTCRLTSSAKISISQAHQNLQLHNARSWKLNIDQAFSQGQEKMKELRGAFWGVDKIPEDIKLDGNILEIPQRPALMGALISDLHVKIGAPSFPMCNLPDFINHIGKGMPYDMRYSSLIPMNVQVDMGEARITLRDYPLPLIHVPPIKPNQPTRLSAWSLKADFVIAEEFRGNESSRFVRVNVIPAKDKSADDSKEGIFSINVRRTISAVKSYSDINVSVNTEYPTRITWGSSFQPAIQDMMMIIETFTKPQVDPSDRTGFWDKIRLSFHSRVSVAWKGDGDVHLLLKGTRDPYAVTGDGAGFLMCWRNNVRWNINRDDDPRKFMSVDSGECILAVPDLAHQARSMSIYDPGGDADSVSSSDSFKSGATFKKVVMKLSGNVQWLAGIMFERNLSDSDKRSFEFTPHYKVVLKRPDCAISTDGLPYDAFRGFRSNHIHLSVAVKAPIDQDRPDYITTNSPSYNTVHLTPRLFSHFFAWWSMFGGSMSLPIRQGALWPGIDKSSKKFARHLATIKYNVLLAPLFISHIHRHNHVSEHKLDEISATGLKIKLDSFMLDVHQRKEEFPSHEKCLKTQDKTSGMKMHEAQLDLISADVRAITASTAENISGSVKTGPTSSTIHHDDEIPHLSSFYIPDDDSSWIDVDDFVEMDWIPMSNVTPNTKILPLAYAPRFTYFRRTDHGEDFTGDSISTSSFGHEPTHFCIMTQDDDPYQVQYDLIKSRLEQLEKQIKFHGLALGDAETKVIQDRKNEALKVELDQLRKHNNLLRVKNTFLQSMMRRMAIHIDTDPQAATSSEKLQSSGNKCGETSKAESCHSKSLNIEVEDDIEMDPLSEFQSDFKNRFVIHNMQLKWNNLLRNIILRYIHQNSQRRGLVYYLSRRAVQFILDIVQEQKKPRNYPKSTTTQSRDTSKVTSSSKQNSQDMESRINEILADGKKFSNTGDKSSQSENVAKRVFTDTLNSNISGEFLPMNSYHLHLIAPQIQLQSEKNPQAVVLVTAKGMEAKIVEVMDRDRIFDNVSGLVQRRFSVEMDSIQFFVTHQKLFSSQLLSMYSGNLYGVPSDSAWPPWVPMEVMFDFKVDPFGFKRVVHKTSASLRYDKFNTLRLKYNDHIGSDTKHGHESKQHHESRMDHLWVEFPQIRAICDSAQYYAMYIIVMDLLMYSEPLEKTRNERIEKIMLASDFSDLRGVPEMVIRLQERIRQLGEMKTYLLINSNYLKAEDSEDIQTLERDLNNCTNELFFMMKAITTSQRKYDSSKTSGLLRWNISSQQIVWHLIRENNEPLLEFQLQRAEYDRTDNSDGSHINLMQVGKIIGLNLLPDAIYPEIFAPYSDVDGKSNDCDKQPMLRVYWYMLESIAGIPVMDHFEVNLIPLKIQLERDVGTKLFDYIFPSSSDSKNKSPFKVNSIQLFPDNEDDMSGASILSPGLENPLSENRNTSSPNSQLESPESRLKPTLRSEPSSKTIYKLTKKQKNVQINVTDGYHFRLFNSNTKGPSKTLDSKTSGGNPHGNHSNRPPLHSLNLDIQPKETSEVKYKRFGIVRRDVKAKKEQLSDDLTKMMGRASSYMTFVNVKIPSVVLCLSYKGKGERNFEDIHDLVFRLPDIEYRNKTWSNLDFALAFKKDVIRSLISHTGAIVANKFKHRPNTVQQHRLREIATSNTVLTPASRDQSYENSDATSSIYPSPKTASKIDRSNSSRRSLASSYNSLLRTPSIASSFSSKLREQGQIAITSAKIETPAASDQVGRGPKSRVKGLVLGRFMKRGGGGGAAVG
ncbi:Bgt-5095 [Blumeria graminis f. sp. tritici]|uniref:Bgt-5095 n=4 Tax=Blumeria graminis f. sp. tritici TaxID=62690 RepID=A0A9X9MNM3_BLUGR|nr:Bgt-5095 [Blumeria graminis f. sp. tritici]